LQTNQLGIIAQIMNYKTDKNKTATEKLIKDYFACANEVNEIVGFFVQELKNC
jgi:UTP:GlnB (protein PII) uridylyltransferase